MTNTPLYNIIYSFNSFWGQKCKEGEGMGFIVVNCNCDKIGSEREEPVSEKGIQLP